MSSTKFPLKWSGVYEYDANPDLLSVPEAVAFDLELQFSTEFQFTGHVRDSESSAMREPGTVNGKLVGNSIEFVKLMPVATFIEDNGDTSRSSDRHPPIYYNGEYVADENLMVGSWHILPKSAGLHEYSGATGTWYADAKP